MTKQGSKKKQKNKKKRGLILGANGQDASYLAELLLEKGYEVFGTIRRNSVPESQTTRIEELHTNGSIKLHYADLTDPISIESVIAITGVGQGVQKSTELQLQALGTNVMLVLAWAAMSGCRSMMRG